MVGLVGLDELQVQVQRLARAVAANLECAAAVVVAAVASPVCTAECAELVLAVQASADRPVQVLFLAVSVAELPPHHGLPQKGYWAVLVWMMSSRCSSS